MTRPALLLSLLLIAAPGARADDAADAVRVRLDLVSERAALAPGQVSWVGVRFAIAPEWHLYWRNPGDSGLPIEVTLGPLPDGVRAGPIAWPAPVRHEREGGFVDFVYEGEVTLLIPIEVAASVPAGSRVDLVARATWLVCKEACEPGEGEARLSLVTAAADAPPEGAGARAVAAARARLPRPLPAEGGRVAVRWEGGALLFEAPGATRLTYFPAAPEEALPADLYRQGVGRGARLRVEYPEAARGVSRVEGVLVVERPDRGATPYRIEAVPPQRGADRPQGRTPPEESSQ